MPDLAENSRVQFDQKEIKVRYFERGGGSGIRTHDTVSRIHAFQASAFSHSATPPDNGLAAI
jgi:hypothetical protein